MKNPYISLHNLKQKMQSSFSYNIWPWNTTYDLPGAHPDSEVREGDFSNIWWSILITASLL